MSLMAKISRLFLCLLLLLALAVSASADSYDASTMRLLRHEGTVEIFDAAGEPRFLLDNVRFVSGESMRTGADGQASVSLDDSRIVSLDKSSRVQFIQEAGHMQLSLLEGSLFLDVQKKLDENESFDIQTTTMTVGIRGTIIFASETPPSADTPAATTIGILEGTGRVTFTDNSGAKRVMDVPAGQKIVIPKDSSSEQAAAPVVSAMTNADIAGFVAEQVLADDTLANRVKEGSENGALLLQSSSGQQEEENQELFPADGNWTWGGTVTIVAQSASKLYDGKPLMRPSDALVYGLPGGFGISVTCSGSITNAGSTENVVSSYSITNSSGEGVTGHFTGIQTVSGTLVVDPAPLVVWTGSDEKVYDSEPLTCDEAGIRTVPGHVSGDPAWKNTSLVTQTALGSERMVALSGRTYVHGTNPLTGQSQQLELKAGQTLSVCLHDEEDGQSLEFQIETLKEDELPEEVLRVYANNPALLAQACEDAGWDPDVMSSLIAALPPANNTTVRSGSGLKVSDGDQDNLMTDSTNVRIHIDSGITNYSTRALTGEEASFTPITLDPSIVVTATGSQTEVGESANTYNIEWGNANPSNYVLKEDLGTLTVLEPEETPPPPPGPTPVPEVTVTASSAEKVYDGTPLTAGTVSVDGLPDGYKVRAAVSGSQTAVGSSANAVTSYTILDESGNDVTSKFPNVTVVSGTLTVNPLSLEINCGGGTFPYSGTAFNPQPVLSYRNGSRSGESVNGEQVVEPEPGPSPSPEGGSRRAIGYLAAAGSTPLRAKADDGLRFVFTLFTGDTVELTLSGMGTEAGTYTLTGSLSSSIKANLDLNLTGTELTIEPCEITVSTGSDEKVYDGSPLFCDDYTVTGMPDDQEFAVEITGEITDAGTADNTFEIDWGVLNPDNYNVMEEPGTLTVKPMDLKFDLHRGGEVTYGRYVLMPPSLNGSEPEISPENPNGPFVYYLPVESDTDETVTLTLSGGLQPDSPVREEEYVTAYSVSFSGNKSNYAVSVTGTSAKVMPAVINISSSEYSQSKTYDGDPCDSSDFVEEIFPVEGYENIYYYIIPYDESDAYEKRQLAYEIDWGDEDANNFIVNYDAGTFEIKKRDLTITSHDFGRAYNGEPLTCPEADIVGLAEGEEISLSFTGSQTEVGSSDNTFSIVWGSVKSQNYNLTTYFGSLMVDPIPITVESATVQESNYYEILTAHSIAITSGSLLPGDSLQVEYTASINGAEVEGNVTIANTFNIIENETSRHYDITKEYGTLTVINEHPGEPDPYTTDSSFGLFSAYSPDPEEMDEPEETDPEKTVDEENPEETDETDVTDKTDESDETSESDKADEPEDPDGTDESDNNHDESADEPDASVNESDDSGDSSEKPDDKPQDSSDSPSDKENPPAVSSDTDVPDAADAHGSTDVSDVSAVTDVPDVSDTPDASDDTSDTAPDASGSDGSAPPADVTKPKENKPSKPKPYATPSDL